MAISLVFTGFSQKGAIKGTVKDGLGETIPGVTVELVGQGKVVQTDFDGVYLFSGLAKGVYAARFSFVEFQTQTITEISVSDDVTYIDVVLKEPVPDSSAKTIEGFVVTAKRNEESTSSLVNEQKNAAGLSDGVSAQVLKTMPVRTTADALKVVSGASIQDNKFAVIRGLNDRYNAAFLNGGALPSTESDRKAFSFDIFPSNMLDRLVITKTATPDKPAEFAGGLIEITTKGIPEKNFITIQGALGYNTITTFKPKTGYKGGKLDWLGIDDGTRKLPSGIPSQGNYPIGIADQAKIAQQVQTNWGTTASTYSPNCNFQLSGGYNTKLFNKKFGIIGALTYNRTFTYTETERRLYTMGTNSAQSAQIEFDYLDHNNVTSTLAGALLNFSMKLNERNDINFKNIYSINTDDKLIARTGTINPLESNPSLIKSNAYWYTQNNIYSGQFSGDHMMKNDKFRVNWLVSYSNVYRNVPSLKRSIYSRKSYFQDPSNPNPKDTMYVANISASSVGPSYGGGIFSSETKESSDIAKIDMTYTFGDVAGRSASTESKGKIRTEMKFGGLTQLRQRNFTARQLGYTKYGVVGGNVSFDQNLLYLPEDQIFSQQNMGLISPGVGGFKLTDGTKSSDSYTATSKLYAGYLMFDHRFVTANEETTGRGFRLIWGARYEYFNQTLNAMKADQVPLRLDTKKPDLLPSANFVYSMNKHQNLRLAYSQTVNRPEYRELAPFAFYDFSTNFVISGNDSLKRAKIHNADLRYEFYPGRGQVFSVTGFYKYFINPIEQVSRPDVTSEISYRNVPSATNYGMELEFRSIIGALFNMDTASVFQNVSMFTNLSIIRSKVDVSGVIGASSSSRPLQGQSPYVFNAGLTYTNPRFDWTFSMNVNRVGPRIAIVGNVNEPDMWEKSRTFLDAQITKGFWKKRAEFKLSVQNLLAQKQIFYQNVTSAEKSRVNGLKAVSNTVFTGDKHNENGYQDGRDLQIWSTSYGPTIVATLTLKF